MTEDWVAQLPMLQFAMNNAPSASTKYSPFQVMFGNSPVTPLDLAKEPPNLRPLDPQRQIPEEMAASRWVRKWWKARKSVTSFVQDNLYQVAEEDDQTTGARTPYPNI